MSEAPELTSSPDPARSGALLEALRPHLPPGGEGWSPARWEALGALGAMSLTLSRWLTRYPDALARMPFPREGGLTREAMAARVEAAVAEALVEGDTAAFDRALRQARHLEMCAIAMAELAGESQRAVMKALSDLADLCLEHALVLHRARALARLELPPDAGQAVAIIALGKHGGRELNFCSDIDVMFVYRRDERFEGATEQALYTRIAEGVRRSLGQQTEDGFVFRVDLDLRPEGRSGPLVNSLDAAEAYYETFGRPWERMALTKARGAAGALDVAEQFISMIRPFVYRRHLDAATIDEMGAMKASLAQARGGAADSELPWDVKLGAGGIRDIEFIVGVHQLLGGGHRSQLRTRGTIDALIALTEAGVLGRKRRDELIAAYLFHRAVEHRLQMEHERQTQRVPEDVAVLGRIGRSLGLGDAAALREKLGAHRRVVRAAFDALFPDATEASTAPNRKAVAVLQAPSEEARVRLLADMGFGAEAAVVVERLARRPHGPFSPAAPAVRQRLGALILQEAAQAPDPQAALRHVEDLIRAEGVVRGLTWILAERPKTVRALMRLFGTSDLLSRAFLAQPELLDRLLLSGRAQVIRERESMRAELGEQLAAVRSDVEAGREELALREAVRFRNQETLRIGLNDITGELNLDEVVGQLSDLAQTILEPMLALAYEEMVERFGRPVDEASGQPASLVVLGLGKLGGREMGYRSDLDLVFVYEGRGETEGGRRAPTTVQDFCGRTVQRLIALLQCRVAEGVLYDVDTALRPSGNQGVLVSSAEAFRRYHERDAQTWERQALLRMRPVAGDLALGARVRDAVEPLVFREGVDPGPEVARMRERMLRERAREVGGSFDVKLGRGGITDVEFTAQVLQLRHGREVPAARWVGTLPALAALRDAGVLPAEDADYLAAALRFLRTLENQLRIARDISLDKLPAGEGARPLLDAVARRMDLEGGEALLERYRSLTDGVRERYSRYVEG